MATTATALMTAEDLAKIPDDGYQYELVRGVLRKMSPTSFRPSNIAARLIVRIGTFVEDHNLGEVTGADGGYKLEHDPDTVLAPDVAFVRADRVPPADEQDRFASLAPDLVVEVMSPSDRMREVEEKIDLYLENGVPLAWVFDPKRRRVIVRRPGQPEQVLREGETLDGEEVLPGFRLPVAAIFR